MRYIYLQLPFNEDIRYYEFPPLDRVQSQKGEIRSDHPLLPSPELSEKMRQFIEQMDLMNVPDEDGQVQRVVLERNYF